jgi:hypothetical protein
MTWRKCSMTFPRLAAPTDHIKLDLTLRGVEYDLTCPACLHRNQGYLAKHRIIGQERLWFEVRCECGDVSFKIPVAAEYPQPNTKVEVTMRESPLTPVTGP